MENLTVTEIIDVGLEARTYQVTDRLSNFEGEEIKALKCYPSTWNQAYYDNEIEICSDLDHPHIVKYFKNRHFTTNQGKYVLMENCEDGNLRQLLSKHRDDNTSMDPNQRIQWLKELIAGIEHIHSKGFVHRDIHPRNIMFKNGHIKIGDFRIIRRDYGGDTRLGSLRYASPEAVNMTTKLAQNDNENPAFHRGASDIWSLAAIMYEMFTGVKLINQEGDLNVIQEINLICATTPAINTGHAGLDQKFRDMLSPDPTRRPTASEIMRVLDGLVPNPPFQQA